MRHPAIVFDSENPTGSEVGRLLRYDRDTGQFFWKRGRGGQSRGQLAGCSVTFKRERGQESKYWVIRVNGKLILRHRMVWAFETGDWLPEIDHESGDSTDDRFSNLRPASHSQNMQNAKRSIANKSGFKGVSWDAQNKKYVARIRSPRGKYENLGRFVIAADAAAAYRNRAIELFGPFARFE